MSEAQNLTDSYDEDDQGSSVFNQIRKDNRKLEKQLAEATAKIEAFEAQAATARADAAQAVVNELGIPGLRDDVLGWVEGDVTADKVMAVLEEKGIPVSGNAPPPQVTPEPVQQPASAVGQRIADAAVGADVQSIDARLAEADSLEEITAIMEEAGATDSYVVRS